MRKVIIYPGRFQPFGKHHYETYKWITERFGADNVYISTSNVVDDKSPLNFEEKATIIGKYGIPKNKIIEADRPYMPVNHLNNFDATNDKLMVVYGQKDYGRISFTKKDGSPSYFKNYTGQHELDSFKDSAYVVVAPHISINHRGNEICGTYLREVLADCTRKEMLDLMGWSDEGVYSIFRRKFQINRNSPSNKKEPYVSDTMYKVEQFKEVFESDTLNQGKYTKHISHPHETDMTFSDLKRFLFDVTKNVQSISNCTLKLDGWNFQMTYKNGNFACSRNKTTVISPMSFEQLNTKYASKEHTKSVFCQAFKVVETALSNIDRDTLERVFKNGSTFINFEIIDTEPLNVFKSNYKALSFHNMVTYDQSGNELHRTSVFPEIIDVTFGRTYNGITIIETPKIELKAVPSADLLISRLTLLQHKFKIPESSKITTLPHEVQTEIRLFIFEVGNAVIKFNYRKPDSIGNVNRIISIIDEVGHSISNQQDLNTVENCFYLLDRLGGLSSINPVEGFVFQWGGKTLKLTGSFGALVPVFNIWNKMRF